MTKDKEEKPELEISDVKPIEKRQVIIETDGASVNIIKSDVSTLELNSICRIILNNIGGI